MSGVLSRRNAAALVSARLASLGHDDDFMTNEAVDELCARAGHQADAFGAALGAVLFLAATEDAPRIESRHVAQAVPMADAAEPAAAARPWRAWQVVAASLSGTALGASLALLLVHGPTTRAPVEMPVPNPHTDTLERPLAATQLKPAAFAKPSPQLAAAPVDLPAAPPLRVSLVVPAGDRETTSHFTSIAQHLRATGFSDVQLETFNSAKTDTRALHHHVVYFFGQDATFAKNVAGALDSAEESAHIAPHWVPILAPAAAGSTSHPPGSIDVFAP